MLHLPVDQSNRQNTRGFTIVELLAIIIIVGILCAIAAPSFLAMQGVAKLNSSLDNLRTALETSQFQAIKTNKQCTISIPANGTSISGNCLITGDTVKLDKDETMMTNIDNNITVTTKAGWKTTSSTTTPTQVIYNSKGITQSEGTIILSLKASSTVTSEQRCLKINAGVGLIRSGKYINNSICEITE